MSLKAYRGFGAPTRDDINVLDCVECGSWFPTFESLAKHMRDQHNPPSPLVHTDKELRRWNRREYIRKGRQDMVKRQRQVARAPRRTAPNHRGGGGVPAPSREAPAAMAPFLKANHIGRRVGVKTAIQIGLTAPRVIDGAYGEQIVVGAKVGAKVYDWAIKIDSANHRMLFDRFGADPKRWKGTVKVEIKEYNGNNYIAVS